jgi:hypothetical protein
VRRGGVLEYAVAVGGADGGADHVLRVEVLDPRNRAPECYQQKVLALKGRYAGRLPFALNDPAGAWQIRVTDVISGKEGVATVTVER